MVVNANYKFIRLLVDDLMDFSTGGLYEWVCLSGLVSLPIVCGSFPALGSVLLLIYILCYLSQTGKCIQSVPKTSRSCN